MFLWNSVRVGRRKMDNSTNGTECDTAHHRFFIIIYLNNVKERLKTQFQFAQFYLFYYRSGNEGSCF